MKTEKSETVTGYDILIDDSVWGFPLGGVLEGAYSFKQDRFITEIIGLEHFRHPNFKQKTYLSAIANASLRMVNELGAEKNDRILVCRGYCNIGIKILLHSHGFTNVSNGVIGEPLQTLLEDEAVNYIKSLGYDNYYDPKGMQAKSIVSNFNGVMKWVIDNNRFDLCKTGWKYFLEKRYLK